MSDITSRFTVANESVTITSPSFTESNPTYEWTTAVTLAQADLTWSGEATDTITET